MYRVGVSSVMTRDIYAFSQICNKRLCLWLDKIGWEELKEEKKEWHWENGKRGERGKMYYGPKQKKHKKNSHLIIHCPTSEEVSEVNKQAL